MLSLNYIFLIFVVGNYILLLEDYNFHQFSLLNYYILHL